MGRWGVGVEYRAFNFRLIWFVEVEYILAYMGMVGQNREVVNKTGDESELAESMVRVAIFIVTCKIISP